MVNLLPPMHWITDLVVVPIGLIALPLVATGSAVCRTVSWMFTRRVKPRGKAIVITGASSGIGEHIAYEYAKAGGKLILAARRVDNLNAVADACREKGAMEVEVVAADVAKEDDCQKIIQTAVDKYGGVDILVNNAGVLQSFEFEQLKDLKAARQLMDIDFFGNVWPTYYAIPHLTKSRGQVIVNSSMAAFLPHPRQAFYNAAKAALFKFYDDLRTEPFGRSVAITIATPGVISSELTEGKFVNETGECVWDEGRPEVHFGPMLSSRIKTEVAAKGIVAGASKRQRYVVVPAYFNIFALYRFFAPGATDNVLHRIMYRSERPGKSLTGRLACKLGLRSSAGSSEAGEGEETAAAAAEGTVPETSGEEKKEA
ncbi:hypothetical protein CBR_g55384 [Chara braunii]|uniref:Ketoreductase domain-containing protein n=1 Tax=Chara braunii TaxID=69332 RepID=A0A388K7L1_CHABU|nr:hypothetical protein CBR_g55384 [Chara braunii]|eukprot:GBG66040.1 hypothetical protein CBR_g55384 [Chara braunii]